MSQGSRGKSEIQHAVVSRRQFLSTAAAYSFCAASAGSSLFAQTEPKPKAQLIDVHHHFVPPFYVNEAREQIAATNAGSQATMADWTPEKSLAEMDRNGVEFAVLSLTTPAVWLGDVAASRKFARKCNEYAAELASRYKNRFGFFAALPLPDPEGSLAELAYALDHLKANGVGVLTSYGDKWPGETAFQPVFDELTRRKAIVYFHPTVPNCCRGLQPGVPAPTLEYPQDTARAITSLMISGTFSRCPDAHFIFSHAGGTLPMMISRLGAFLRKPEYAEKIPHGFEYELKRLFYEIANSANKPAIAAITSLVPTSQIMFGTDYPFVPVGATANGMKTVGLSDSDLKAIGWETASRLLGRKT